MGNQIYKEISKFAEMQRDEIKREKAKKKRKAVCIDPDSVIGKEIMYQTALLHEILDEIRGEKNLPLEKIRNLKMQTLKNRKYPLNDCTRYLSIDESAQSYDWSTFQPYIRQKCEKYFQLHHVPKC